MVEVVDQWTVIDLIIKVIIIVIKEIIPVTRANYYSAPLKS